MAIKNIKKGSMLNKKNIWVKRPGTGDFLARDSAKNCLVKKFLKI